MAMLFWKRLLLAGLAGILCIPIFGVTIFVALSYAFRCPPDHPVCDLPDMAAFGLACLGGPLAGALVGWYAWRRLPTLTRRTSHEGEL
jgi:hypothetical protein